MAVTQVAYGVTSGFPADERFGPVSQLRRSAVSLPSSIAEGRARFSTKDNRKHISYAMGSLAEVETQLLLSRNLGYTTAKACAESLDTLLEDCDVLGKKLRRLAQALERKLGQE